MKKTITKILIICGPTGIGKSLLAVNLAKGFNAEIVGADSMQIYRKFNIGTGKITQDEMQGVAHHMIDILDPQEEYSVGRYVSDVKKVIEEVSIKGKNIIIVGGTGLYLNALTSGFNLAGVEKDVKLRERLTKMVDAHGNGYAYGLLKSKDAESAVKIAPADTKRIIRALEIFELSGQGKSKRIESVLSDNYEFLQIVLLEERERLYSKINARVDAMLASGLEDEARDLFKYAACQSASAIGYKEMFTYFSGELNLNAAIDKIKQHSRNYAKRQITYFKWMKVVNKHFVDVGDVEKVKALVDNFWS